MYKIREAAQLLKVETIEIHKKLISLRKELQGHVQKVNGITTIDQEGIDIISLSFSDTMSEQGLLKESIPFKEEEWEGLGVTDRITGKDFSRETHENTQTIPELGSEATEEKSERDISSIKAEINLKKTELNMLNQRLVSELQRSMDYTKELNDLHQKLGPYFR